MSTNKALVVFAHGEGFVLTAECEELAIEQFLSDIGADADAGFDLDRPGIDFAWAMGGGSSDGLWVGDLMLADDGPGDWPGQREVCLQLFGLRPATADEWARYRAGEWIWVVPEDERPTRVWEIAAEPEPGDPFKLP